MIFHQYHYLISKNRPISRSEQVRKSIRLALSPCHFQDIYILGYFYRKKRICFRKIEIFMIDFSMKNEGIFFIYSGLMIKDLIVFRSILEYFL